MSAAEADRGAGLAAVVLATVVFSTGFILAKVVPLEPAALALWRLAIGSGTLALAAVLLRTPWPHTSRATVLAGVAFGLHQLLYIGAVQATSVSIATLVAALQPLLVALSARLTVAEPVSPRLVACAALALAGVGVVVHANLGDPSRSLAGDVLSVLNLLAFTAYFLSAKRARQGGVPTLTLTASFLFVSLLVVLPFALAGSQRLVPTATELGLIAVLALVPGNGHLLVNWAHRRVSATLSSLVLASVPVLASLWARVVLDEPLGWRHVAGMALVIASIEAGRRVERRPRTALACARMDVQVFGLAKSQATRKAQRFFSERRVGVAFVDCKVRPPAPGELRRWVQRFGVEALLDPGSKAYRDQGLQYVSASDEDWIERMAANPAVLRLPLARCGRELTVGEDPDGWQRLADAARAG